jgi:hypothetical protein
LGIPEKGLGFFFFLVFLVFLAFPCFVIGLLAFPLCGGALTFFAAVYGPETWVTGVRGHG